MFHCHLKGIRSRQKFSPFVHWKSFVTVFSRSIKADLVQEINRQPFDYSSTTNILTSSCIISLWTNINHYINWEENQRSVSKWHMSFSIMTHYRHGQRELGTLPMKIHHKRLVLCFISVRFQGSFCSCNFYGFRRFLIFLVSPISLASSMILRDCF